MPGFHGMPTEKSTIGIKSHNAFTIYTRLLVPTVHSDKDKTISGILGDCYFPPEVFRAFYRPDKLRLFENMVEFYVGQGNVKLYASIVCEGSFFFTVQVGILQKKTTTITLTGREHLTRMHSLPKGVGPSRGKKRNCTIRCRVMELVSIVASLLRKT